VSPRHWTVRCSKSESCDYKSTRTADSLAAALSKPCPRCGKSVESTLKHLQKR
jgi:hypothetical protein